MKKILITGLDSFTGRYLSDLLQSSGYDVFGTVLSVGSCNETIASEKLFTVDVRDSNHVQSVFEEVRPHHVIHLAAISFVGHDCVDDFYSINVVGSENILSAAVSVGCESVIVASSANIYGNTGSDAPITEDFAPYPENHYAISKVALEHLCAIYNKTIPIIVMRPFNYTGPGQSEKFLIPKIVKHFANHEDYIELGNTDVIRDFSDVRDVAHAYYLALRYRGQYRIFNICSSNVWSINDVINELRKISQNDIEVVVNQDFIRDNEIKVLRGSRNLISKELGYYPSIILSETLRDMYAAAKNI